MLNKVNEIKRMIKKEVAIVEKDSNLIVSINRFKEVDFIKSILRITNQSTIKNLIKDFVKENTSFILD